MSFTVKTFGDTINVVMKFNPPIINNGIEVTSINEDVGSIHFIVHVEHGANKTESNHRIHMMIQYLETEGFIEHRETWLTHVGVIIHNKQK